MPAKKKGHAPKSARTRKARSPAGSSASAAATKPNGVRKRKAVPKPRKSEKIIAPSKKEKKTKPRKKASAAEAAIGRATDDLIPAFRAKKKSELTKEEQNKLSAHFMRQNRRRHTLEKGALEFNSVVGGSVLLATVTGGGAKRRGRIYVKGSGRFGESFFDAKVGDVLATSNLNSWREAKKVSVREFITAMSDGARHTATINESARAATQESESEESDGAPGVPSTSTEEEPSRDDDASMEDA